MPSPVLLRSRWRGRALAAAALVFFSLKAAAADAPPLMESFIPTTYGADSGLPQPIRDLVQTRDGYIWVATEAGLARFDGVKFTLYRTAANPGLRQNIIQCLCECRGGILWIGTYGGLSRYQNGAFEAIGPGNLPITAFAEDTDGTLWIGTESGLWRCRDGEMSRENVPLLGNAFVHCLKLDREGRLWIAGEGTPLIYRENGGFKTFRHDGRTLEHVTSIAQSHGGDLWFTTSNSALYRLSGGSVASYSLERGQGNSRGVTTDFVNREVFVDRQDRVWVGANGVYLLGVEKPNQFERVIPTTLESTSAIAEDSEGDIWIGTPAHGLICLKPVPLRTYSDEEGPLRSNVRSVAEDRAGNLWLAVANSPIMVRRPDGTLEEGGLGAAPDSYSVCVTDDGTIWSGGAAALQANLNGQMRRFPDQPMTRALFQDRAGRLWIAASNRPVVRYQDGAFETIGGRGGVPVNPADCFAEDAQGTLYIGLVSAGLVRLQNGAATVENTDTGLPSNHVRAILADREGHIWIGTRGRGLAVFADGRWLNPQAFSDMFEDEVSSLIEDGQGRLFIGTLKGIFYAATSDLLAMARGGPPADVHAVILGGGIRSDGINSGTQPVACRAHDGTLWFGARRGLFGIDPKGLGRNTVPPPVYVEGAVVDNRPLDIGRGLELSPGNHALAIDYAAIGFARPREMLFKYILEGYDSDWIDARNRHTAYYSNLWPGHYNFRVKACNDDGVWNETGAALEVTQRPWFYQTAWFRALMAGVMGGGVFGFYRWRVHTVRQRASKLRLQNTELERRIAERTADLAKSVEALRESEYSYSSLIESLPQIIVRKDAEGKYTYASKGFAEMLGRPLDQVIGHDDRDLHDADMAKQIREDDLRVMATGQPLEREQVIEGQKGDRRFLHLKKVPLYDEHQQPIGVLGLFWDMTVFRETEDKLKTTQRELIESSRLAGMAEAATGVLHNFGNALTSVNISSTLVLDRMAKLKLAGVIKVAELLIEQRGRLAEFFENDPRGQQLPDYLEALAKHLDEEREATVHELTLLRRSIEHINGIVAEQQKNAKIGGATEAIAPTELVEYALSMTEASLHRHGIVVSREYMQTQPVHVPRQRVLQILVNLIRNAKDSMLEKDDPKKQLIVGVRASAADRAQIFVSDNGLGIDRENLDRIFSFGFTTKQSGHGFGLHSSILAAKELGGSLTAQSPGPGRGATFVLDLPTAPEPQKTGDRGKN